MRVMPDTAQPSPIVQTSVRMPQTDYEALRRRAEQEDRTVAYLVRKAIRLMLATS